MEAIRQTHTDAFPEPVIQVPGDIERNIMVTSVDALLNWSRKSALWPVAFGLACCAFEMMASAMGRFRHSPVRDGGFQGHSATGRPHDRGGHGHLEDGAGHPAHL